MDEQEKGQDVLRGPEAEQSPWPKKRTLLIDARDVGDFIAAERILKRFREDIEKYGTKPGRHNFISYSSRDESTGKFVRHIAVWYTTNQVTVYFNHEKD